MATTKRQMSWLLGLFLIACGGDLDTAAPPDDPGIMEAIIGGTPTTGDPAIVALYAQKPGETKGSLCTAEIISPTVVLTAAHCVHPELVGAGAQFSVLTAANLTDPNKPSPRLAVKETHFDPQFSRTNITNGHDIGVAILAQPTTIQPIPFNRAALTSAMVGQPARIVGYGLNDGFQQKGAGIKRTATVKLNGYDDKLVRTGDWIRRICSGDSGGPVLMKINGKETIVGVNSFGFIFCLGQGYSTRVDRYTSFIDKYLK
jgi:secreted trypsin-like serine protease